MPREEPREAKPKAINNADHGIQRVEEAESLRHHAALKPDGRNIKSKLNHERHNETEISILDHECGNPGADAERGAEYQKHEEREKQDQHGVGA